jgi:hypothetical protein
VTRVSSSDVFPSRSYSGNHTTPATEHDQQSFQYFLPHLREIWQQVYRTVNVYYESSTALYAFRKSGRASSSFQPTPGETTKLSELVDKHAEEQTAPKMLLSNGSNAAVPTPPPTTPQPLAMPTHTPDSAVAAEGQSKGVGQGPNSESTRGSCMAIIIGLVVGVIWF